jgi:hypothetical protein
MATWVARTTLWNGRIVSTVDLGDTVFWDSPFETMVFRERGNFHDLDSYRNVTREEALATHRRMVIQWGTSADLDD